MSTAETEYKIDPTEKNFLNYDYQCSQDGYGSGTGPLNLQNPQLSESIQSHPPITEILSANLTVPEVAAYQQVRTENSFNADKYSTSECFNILGDSGYDDQMMSSYSEQCYDYSLQSNSGCQSLNTSTYQVEQSEDEFRPFVQDTRNDAYNYATVMQNTSDYSDFYGNPDNQEFANQDFSSYAGHEPRKRRAYENDQARMRSSSNCQLNPTAVAIMDAWYRKHLDRPYPNKEEKLNMAIAGSITETQVGSWFANRRNRSNNTRPKQNMKRLKSAISSLCMEYQARCNGLINGSELQARILALIEQHMKV
ncbi:unnamed protein product [Hymenolepis diminuta]|uniref:Homeobox domain-containing protein n=2 Tax=Hymenolepis diminuta TaxID=6216 RepID=A0A0R3SA24_HYMDI|nr:unnamed protein product [Hymenolepis diminuta]